MLKQPNDVKKMLTLLLAIFFVVTLTVVTASAADSVVEVTNLSQINDSLQNGPVFLEIGAEWCGPCQEMKPILQDLATEYAGKATIMSADIDKSPKLADYFGVSAIPDSSVIVGIESGEYVYMQEDGNVTKDRFNARILGLRDKQVFENVLNLAIGGKNLPIFPGCTKSPKDLDKDGLYEDINGNGKLESADVVVYFKNLQWIKDNGLTAYFDFNRDGRINSADVIALFKMIH